MTGVVNVDVIEPIFLCLPGQKRTGPKLSIKAEKISKLDLDRDEEKTSGPKAKKAIVTTKSEEIDLKL